MKSNINARQALAAALAMAVWAAPAGAQDVLIIGGLQINAAEDPGRPIGVVSYDLMRPLAGGGRYAVRDTDVRDLRTGSTWPLPVGSVLLTVDPSRPRIFLRENCDVPADRCDLVERNLETGAGRVLTTIAASSATGGDTAVARYAADVDILFVDQAPSRAGFLNRPPHAIRGLNLHSGEWVGPTLAPLRGWWAVTADGTRLVANRGLTFPVEELTVSYNVATGAVVASASRFNTLMRFDWNPALRAFVSEGVVSVVFDADLRVLASSMETGCVTSVAASAHTGRIFSLTGGGGTATAPIPYRFLAYDPASGWRAHDIERKTGIPPQACAAMVLLSPPGAASSLEASVRGREVTLRWGNTTRASRYELEIGLAPGRTDLVTALGPDPWASFIGVPAGVYYVRLRGANDFGWGQRSVELRITVP